MNIYNIPPTAKAAARKTGRRIKNTENQFDFSKSETQKDVEHKILLDAFMSKEKQRSQLEKELAEVNKLNASHQTQIACQQQQIAMLIVTYQGSQYENAPERDDASLKKKITNLQDQNNQLRDKIWQLYKKIKEKNCEINNIQFENKKELKMIREKHRADLKNTKKKLKEKYARKFERFQTFAKKTEEFDDEYFSCSEDFDDDSKVPENLKKQSTAQIETEKSLEAVLQELSVTKNFLNTASAMLDIQRESMSLYLDYTDIEIQNIEASNSALRNTYQCRIKADEENIKKLMEENKALRANMTQNKMEHQLEIANLQNRLSDAYGFNKWE
ncbi:Protein CBG08878 [Caenorhabditis briggsae]|uniref:Uncharacterized protein n=2 Tax=Caenorhabditis briggsae TaxID=6238 RepID=A0AAE9CXH0_CAEBR|nr:Protein CBG08878 [Caenorhabditis briggsae]ULT85272.1 hypothetical protein L3Y34_013809 [Caenorhabditis briggsae]CAP28627.2 Protein CBG08878 [Caenorhabditis briggsae]